MSSSAFSFHCMICFEEFDPQTNYPVVLPCGHTYVCISCANRLDKCMECRTPLFIKIEDPPPPPPPPSWNEHDHNNNPNHRQHYNHHTENRHDQHATRSYSPSIRSSPAGLRSGMGMTTNRVLTRHGGNSPHRTYARGNSMGINSNNNYYNDNNNKPPQNPPVKKERLPLPKNAVLLSLIQASEPARRRTEDNAPPLPSPSLEGVEKKLNGAVGGNSGGGGGGNIITSNTNCQGLPKFARPSPLFLQASSSGENEAEEDEEEQKIRVGTYLSGGPCGTYAVAAKTGLLVYPTLFEHTLHPIEDVVKRDVEEIVKTSYKINHPPKKPSVEDAYPLEKSQTWVESHDNTHYNCNDSEGKEDGSDGNVAGTQECILPPNDLVRTQSALGALEIGRTPQRNARDKYHDPQNHQRENIEIQIQPRLPQLPPSPLTNTTAAASSSFATAATTTTIPPTANTKLQRQFSYGSHPSHEEFDRPLLRLKYGDRVQVVSMDSRGWVKLARGYGYIRLENDKQLVKVGGTSDKACQIEAILHELSVERNRLKHEQQKLERLSSGLMIDLQSSLLMDEDHVIVPAPEGLPRSDSELSGLLPDKNDRHPSNVSVDDIDVSVHSRRSVLPSPRSFGNDQDNKSNNANNEQPREIRTAKSHSPGRTNTSSIFPFQSTTPIKRGKAPPSPGNNSNFASSTPTRVNFRTGLSGHRALSSTLSHPHDFIDQRGPSRSMSNHAGLSHKKPSTRGGRSIY